MDINIWSRKKENRLRWEYPYVSTPRKLAAQLGVTYNALKSRATLLGLKRKLKAYGRTTATPADDACLRQHYLTTPVNAMAKHIGRSEMMVKIRMRQLHLVQPPALIEKFKLDSRIKKGNVPFNKGRRQTEYMSAEAIERTKATRFKKGEIPLNKAHYQDGDITLRHRKDRPHEKPHYYIRISLRNWKELQIHNWEKVNGPVPKGFVLACKDGNTLHCDPSNWYLLSKADNARRNAGHKNLPDSYVAHCIAGRNGKDLLPAILQEKNLIELKRQQLILKRNIYAQQQTLSQDA